jgi:restriction endonuclease S subunit
LGEVCEFRPKPYLDDLSNNMKVSFVPMADLGQNKMSFSINTTKSIEEVKTGYTYFENGDVLLAKITPCFENGKSGIAKNLKNNIGFGSTEFIVIRGDKQKIKPEWIYCIINSEKFLKLGANNMTGSAGQRRVPIDFVTDYKIPLPSLADQERIVAALSEEQSIIAANERLIYLMQNKIDKTISRIYKK